MPPTSTTLPPARKSTASALTAARASMTSKAIRSSWRAGHESEQRGSDDWSGHAVGCRRRCVQCIRRRYRGHGPADGDHGKRALVKSGTGTLTLSGNDTYPAHQRVSRRIGPRPGRFIGQHGGDDRQPPVDGAALQVNGNYTIGTGGGASLAVGSRCQAPWPSTRGIGPQHIVAQRKHGDWRHYRQPGNIGLQYGQRQR